MTYKIILVCVVALLVTGCIGNVCSVDNIESKVDSKICSMITQAGALETIGNYFGCNGEENRINCGLDYSSPEAFKLTTGTQAAIVVAEHLYTFKDMYYNRTIVLPWYVPYLHDSDSLTDGLVMGFLPPICVGFITEEIRKNPISRSICYFDNAPQQQMSTFSWSGLESDEDCLYPKAFEDVIILDDMYDAIDYFRDTVVPSLAYNLSDECQDKAAQNYIDALFDYIEENFSIIEANLQGHYPRTNLTELFEMCQRKIAGPVACMIRDMQRTPDEFHVVDGAVFEKFHQTHTFVNSNGGVEELLNNKVTTTETIVRNTQTINSFEVGIELEEYINEQKSSTGTDVGTERVISRYCDYRNDCFSEVLVVYSIENSNGEMDISTTHETLPYATFGAQCPLYSQYAHIVEDMWFVGPTDVEAPLALYEADRRMCLNATVEISFRHDQGVFAFSYTGECDDQKTGQFESGVYFNDVLTHSVACQEVWGAYITYSSRTGCPGSLVNCRGQCVPENGCAPSGIGR